MRGMFYDWHRNGQTIAQDGYTTDLIAAECVDWIAATPADKPFFLFVPFNAVHGPDEAPQPLIDKYTPVTEKHRDLSPAKRSNLAVQYAMLDSMDSAIGRVLKALDSRGVADNTLVVFFNDNGGRQENPPFRDGKGSTYEGGVRVPCLWNWKGHIPAGTTCDGLAHAVDLYPTLVGLAGGSLEQPLALDGLDLWEMISQGAASPRTEVVLSVPGSMESETGTPAIRSGNYKLVGAELFDLATDAAETTNIATANPEIAARLHRRLNDLAAERRTPEVHANVSRGLDRPLLVFGEQENANPPDWLAEYVRTHGEPKERRDVR
jgi:arylsulfatase A-like enzyme